jgi:hypothetical protein
MRKMGFPALETVRISARSASSPFDAKLSGDRSDAIELLSEEAVAFRLGVKRLPMWPSLSVPLCFQLIYPRERKHRGTEDTEKRFARGVFRVP